MPTTAPNSRCRVTGTLQNPSLISTSQGSLQACQDSCFFYTEEGSDCKTFGYNKSQCRPERPVLKARLTYMQRQTLASFSTRHCPIWASRLATAISSTLTSTVLRVLRTLLRYQLLPRVRLSSTALLLLPLRKSPPPAARRSTRLRPRPCLPLLLRKQSPPLPL